MRRSHILIVTLTLVVLTGTLWVAAAHIRVQRDWSWGNPYVRLGLARGTRRPAGSPVHRYFYRVPLPIYVCPTTPPSADAKL